MGHAETAHKIGAFYLSVSMILPSLNDTRHIRVFFGWVNLVPSDDIVVSMYFWNHAHIKHIQIFITGFRIIEAAFRDFRLQHNSNC